MCGVVKMVLNYQEPQESRRATVYSCNCMLQQVMCLFQVFKKGFIREVRELGGTTHLGHVFRICTWSRVLRDKGSDKNYTAKVKRGSITTLRNMHYHGYNGSNDLVYNLEMQF